MIKMQDAVLRCRQQVARILLEHQDNKTPKESFTKGDSMKRSLEDGDERNSKKAKLAHKSSVCLLLPSTHLQSH